LPASLCGAQPNPPFQHIIIIVQENRTPDNLFGASGIPGINAMTTPQGTGIPLAKGPDLPHGYSEFIFETRSGNKMPTAYYDYVASGAQPYWDMAAEYGFANQMYQTNQSESFPSHQFLISGTSAPSDTSDLFVLGNSTDDSHYGCGAAANALVSTIDPNGVRGTIYPCFERSSILELLDNAGITWKYYTPSGGGLWDAPLALENYYQSPNIVIKPPQVLKDIAAGKLAGVSWVTPAGAYSDHPGSSSGGGPAWVASIVNAIGQSPYWNDTAILVTWDDWGGWYDHVIPLGNHTGWCQIFCYGFRVPLLVISSQTPPGYVDNDVHDFGSILHFVESNFNLGFIGPGTWADSYADDLSGFFQAGGDARRGFVPIKARKMTRRELADHSDPDDD